ncbi:hypothetical protein [Clostridium sp.]|uniref:hypothetical protein n=1 Tax=Clostridium sp. TaxID=1506 RepID=UPI0026184BD5|nr:hypothetical protein [Clostridium sp.]
MIFKAVVIPTPKRIRKYIENTIDKLNTESIIFDDSAKESIEKIEHIDIKKDNFKNLGISVKLF